MIIAVSCDERADRALSRTLPGAALSRGALARGALSGKYRVEPIQTERMNQEGTYGCRDAPQCHLNGLHLDTQGSQRILHKEDRAERNKHILAKEEPDVVGRGGHGSDPKTLQIPQSPVTLCR